MANSESLRLFLVQLNSHFRGGELAMLTVATQQVSRSVLLQDRLDETSA